MPLTWMRAPLDQARLALRRGRAGAVAADRPPAPAWTFTGPQARLPLTVIMNEAAAPLATRGPRAGSRSPTRPPLIMQVRPGPATGGPGAGAGDVALQLDLPGQDFLRARRARRPATRPSRAPAGRAGSRPPTRARLPSRIAVWPGRAMTVLPSITKRLSPAGFTAMICSTRPSISRSPWPMPLRRSSTSVTVMPSTATVTVSAWLGRTSLKASAPDLDAVGQEDQRERAFGQAAQREAPVCADRRRHLRVPVHDDGQHRRRAERRARRRRRTSRRPPCPRG